MGIGSGKGGEDEDGLVGRACGGEPTGYKIGDVAEHTSNLSAEHVACRKCPDQDAGVGSISLSQARNCGTLAAICRQRPLPIQPYPLPNRMLRCVRFAGYEAV